MPIAADSPLTRHIAEVRLFTPPLRPVDHLPDGTASLMFRLVEPGRADLSVMGPRTRAFYKRAPNVVHAIQIVFRPGAAYPFFGVPLDELTDRRLSASDLWGRDADALLAQLVDL